MSGRGSFCRDCRCFRKTSGPISSRGDYQGECRFDPPRFDPNGGTSGVFPTVQSNWWCSKLISRDKDMEDFIC